jgi:hypothetical protein
LQTGSYHIAQVSLGWPWAHSPPACVSSALGLQACTTGPTACAQPTEMVWRHLLSQCIGCSWQPHNSIVYLSGTQLEDKWELCSNLRERKNIENSF